MIEDNSMLDYEGFSPERWVYFKIKGIEDTLNKLILSTNEVQEVVEDLMKTDIENNENILRVLP